MMTLSSVAPSSVAHSDTEKSAVSITGILLRLFLLLLLVALLSASWLFVNWLNEPGNFPFKKLELVNKLEYQDSKQLQKVIVKAANNGFFSLDISQLRVQLLTELPWVKSVSIRKIWPDKLQLNIIEHQPAARWSALEIDESLSTGTALRVGTPLLSQDGVVFSPVLTTPQKLKFKRLVLLTGNGRNTTKVLTDCVQINKQLQLLALAMQQCGMNSRRSWELKMLLKTADNTIDGIAIKLGKEKIMAHLGRFIEVFSGQLKPYLNSVAVVDLRYANGFSVKWKHYGSLYNDLLPENDLLRESLYD